MIKDYDKKLQSLRRAILEAKQEVETLVEFAPDGQERHINLHAGECLLRIFSAENICAELVQESYYYDGNYQASSDSKSITRPHTAECICESASVVRCDLYQSPVVKSRKIASKIDALLAEEIRCATRALGENKPLFLSKVFVIFVSYYEERACGKPQYFDNDNLMIKQILDAFVSLFCNDDAAAYCTNIYTTGYDRKRKASIYIVEYGHLREWAESHLEIDFASEVLGIPCQE